MDILVHERLAAYKSVVYHDPWLQMGPRQLVPASRFDRASYQVEMKHFIFGGKPDMTTEGEVCFYVAPKLETGSGS